MAYFACDVSLSLRWGLPAADFASQVKFLFRSLLAYSAVGALVIPPLLLTVLRASQHLKFHLAASIGLEACHLRLPSIFWIEKMVLVRSPSKGSLVDLLLGAWFESSDANLLFIFLIVGHIRVFPIVELVEDEVTHCSWQEGTVIYLASLRWCGCWKWCRCSIIGWGHRPRQLGWIVVPKVFIVEQVLDVRVRRGI